MKKVLLLSLFAGISIFAVTSFLPSAAAGTSDSALPFTNNQIVSAAVGQPNVTTANNGAVTDARMNSPWDVAVDPATAKVYVADFNNHRVLRFADTQTMISGGIAEAVFGQTLFTTRSTGNSLSQMSEPRGVAIGPDGRLWVSDAGNNRILYFNSPATASNGVAADGRLITSGPGFIQPRGLDVDSGGRLWVADMGNDRVVRFNTPGHGNLTPSARACSNGGVSASTCSQPQDVHVDDNDNLWVADTDYNRVLRFNNASTLVTGTAASGVLGQISFTTAELSTAQNRVGTPRGVTTDPNGNLYVSDENSLRIMIFSNAAELPNGANALGVLGQTHFTNASPPPVDRGAHPPVGLAFDPVRWDLLASDPSRNRVIRYDGVDPDPDLPPSDLATEEAINITATTATLQGYASPNAAGTFGYFRYGTTQTLGCTESYGTRAPLSGGVVLGSGTAQIPFSLNVSGLSPGTTYYFCAAAENAGGRAFGAAFSFTTAGLPDVVTDAATDVRTTTATLRGFVDPNGDATTAYFRYSNFEGVCSDSFGTRTPASGGVSIPADASQTLYSQNIDGLTPFTTYYFCSVAENGAGKSFGVMSSFTTRDQLIYFVDNETDDAAASLNACTPTPNDCSLRGAVSIAGDGDTIQFQQQETLAELLAPAATISLASEIEINYDIVINGPGVSNMWMLAWNGTRVFTIAAGADVSVNNMRMSGAGGGAHVNNFGGAVLVQGELQLDRVEIFDSFAAQNGGAVYVDNGGVLEIRNSAVYGNNAGQSGGAIAGNTANILIENSTVSGNSDAVGSGAAYFDASIVTIRNSTITANSSTGGNGAGGVTSFGSTLEFASSIISGNNSPSASDIANLFGSNVTSLGFNMIGDDAGDSVNTGNAIVYQSSDILDAPHMLGLLQNNGGPTLTHSPSGAFPGKDKGCAFGLAFDQRGQTRTRNWTSEPDAACAVSTENGTDIGAVEMLAPTAAEVSISGRALSLNGMGIKNAVITVHGDGGNARNVVTNTFGYYRVEGLTAGSTYIVTIRAAKYSFLVPTRIFALDDNITNADFTANR